MRRVTIPLLASCAGLALAGFGTRPAAAQARPSFDCGRATEADEVAICSDPALARLDVLHADRYAAARRADPRGADANARESLAERHACGNDRLCILDRMASDLSDDAPGWVGSYRARLVREVARDDLRPKSLGRVGKPQSFQTTAHGIQATLARVDGLDTPRASASGVVTPSDEMEYCVRDWERNARHGRRPTRTTCARSVRDLDTRFESSADCPAGRVTLPDGTWTFRRFDGDMIIWADPEGEEQQPWNGTMMADAHMDLLCPNTLARLRAAAAAGGASMPVPVAPSPPRPPVPATVAGGLPDGMTPYARTGVVDCAAPGTGASFGLTGDGKATLTRMESDHAPFREAGKVSEWTASLTPGNPRLLVLDDGAGTRIMAALADGRGMAFAKPSGTIDVLCRILVSPE